MQGVQDSAVESEVLTWFREDAAKVFRTRLLSALLPLVAHSLPLRSQGSFAACRELSLMLTKGVGCAVDFAGALAALDQAVGLRSLLPATPPVLSGPLCSTSRFA